MSRGLLSLLLLAFFVFSAYADVFESIDCGASDFYTDENSIVWTDDALLNGESAVVQSRNGVSHVMSTLRVFRSRKKNCYSVKADKGGEVLIRASFFYGNYDKKSSPPTFDLQFDGNYWVTVQTLLDQIVAYEVAYIFKGDYLSVCLAQTHPNQFPFISALEVRSLGSNTYGGVDASYALHSVLRVSYGANETVRYPSDTYDRIWFPAIVGDGLATVKGDAIIINTEIDDNPPQEVLQDAITTSNTTDRILLGTGLPAKEVPVYINMYFSEVTELDSTQIRSFQIYLDNKPFSDPILPNYGGVNERIISNMTASGKTSFSLVATADSTLPPLINAMEVFYVSGPLTYGTNSKDVDGLGELQTAFSTLQDWVGDPCLPSPYTWDWVNCSNDAIPRITALYLNGYDLSGSLPDFSSMDALEILDLHNNSIAGPIPDFLGALPNLRQLNLADNAFSGPIPTSLSENTKLKLVVSGNPALCVSGKSCQTTSTDGTGSPTAGSSGSKKKSKLPVILGSIIPIFIVFWIIVGVLVVHHNKRKRAAIAAVSAGHAGGGADGPNSRLPSQALNKSMMGKIGESVINEIQMNIQDETTRDITDHSHPNSGQPGN
ncbi:putative leucine-rich repeat receptor-like protein kinase At2g19210 [Ricinus communis]|uniref:putative leucine-rich repeat receptor-like protein kinase At2g19210 n=1 Tax=Ricinus communis TaxID=3988 RepID=UPI00201AAD2D|nr:putative leucine-rich repeat receptor-like protein kinase At2g19210 [Ricinus communis]